MSGGTSGRLINMNPLVLTTEPPNVAKLESDLDPLTEDPIDAEEVFEIVRNIRDPEYPYSLEQLGVLRKGDIEVHGKKVIVRYTPTIPQCTLASVIGLCVKIKLIRTLPANYKIYVHLSPHTHNDEANINKQLDDKERVCAAMESDNVQKMINKSISGTDDIDVYLPFLK